MTINNEKNYLNHDEQIEPWLIELEPYKQFIKFIKGASYLTGKIEIDGEATLVTISSKSIA